MKLRWAKWWADCMVIAIIAMIMAFNIAIILGIVWLAAKIVKAVFS